MADVKTCIAIVFAAALIPPNALAQSAREGAAVPPGATSSGDTGLWFVSTAEVLPGGVYAAGVSAGSELRDGGSVKASYGAVSLARGVADRAEVFGAWHVTTEIDDRRGRGDALAGVKIGLLSQRRGAPLALAARGVVKLPSGRESLGVTTGKTDLLTEVVVSRQFGRADVTGSTGVIVRGDPEGATLPTRVRSGAGLAVRPSRALAVFTEVQGESGRDATAARLVSPLDTAPTAAAGVSWQAGNGFSATAGISRAIGDERARGVGAAVRIGFRPGGRRVATSGPPAPPATSLPPDAAPPPPPGAASAAPAPEIAPAPSTPAVAFDDVRFDLDRYSLRADALPILDRAVEALQRDPTLRLQIQGHACDMGTAEYNLALGDRRAHAVRDYLVSRGVAADRLQTVSYGEERPKHDNSVEATRALNRRAELHPLETTTSSF